MGGGGGGERVVSICCHLSDVSLKNRPFARSAHMVRDQDFQSKGKSSRTVMNSFVLVPLCNLCTSVINSALCDWIDQWKDNKNNKQLYLHDHINTYSVAKAFVN